MKVELQLHGVDGVLATLQSLPEEVVSRRGGPVKSALRKGALVILKAEQTNLRAVMGHQVDAERIISSGLLLKNLIVTRGKAPTIGKGERYLVRVKRRAYKVTDRGHLRTEKGAATTTENAQRLEYGTSKQPAEPFIRPAFLANAERAITVIQTELVAGVNRIVNKLAIQNRGK